MKLDTFYLLCLGYFMHLSDAAQNKDVQLTTQAPAVVHKHTQTDTHTIQKKSPDDYKGGPFVGVNHIVNHKNQYKADQSKHSYDSDDKPNAKQKKKKDYHKHEAEDVDDDMGFKEYLGNFKKAKPEEKDLVFFDDGGFKTAKSVHTEHYEVKKINPQARFPDEKYIIQGAYKVQETDPFDFTTTSFHTYDSPISKIAASILSKYDYTNFKPYGKDEFRDDKDKDDDDHDSIEEYGGNKGRYNKKTNDYTIPYTDKKSKATNDIGYDDYSHNDKKTYDYTSPVNQYYEDYKNKKKKNKDIDDYSVPYDQARAKYNSGERFEYLDKEKNSEKAQDYIGEYQQGLKQHPVEIFEFNDKETKNNNVNTYTAPYKNGKITVSTDGSYEDYSNDKKPVQTFTLPFVPEAPKKKNKYTVPYKNGKITVITDGSYEDFSNEKEPVETFTLPFDHEHVKVHHSEAPYDYTKEFDHLVSAEHVDDYHPHDHEWEKYLIEHVYGNDFGASTKFVQKVLPDNSKRQVAH